MKCISYWYERDQLEVVPTTIEYAADIPDDLLTKLEAARAEVRGIESQIEALTSEAARVENARLAAMTPKARREENFSRMGIHPRV